MTVLKISGNIFKAQLTKREEAAMHKAVQECVADYDRKNQDEIDAMVMMILHMEFGWGKDRLRRFHNSFIRRMDELCKRYEAEEERGKSEDEKEEERRRSEKFIATQWCKDYGIDLVEWSRDYEREKAAKGGG